ncbi:hypothetical protein NQZ68_008381 [Dissostichus eleginoides]|nr:hypothetical protein NQZ68_008381 [Dissostichus eleginoides]
MLEILGLCPKRGTSVREPRQDETEPFSLVELQSGRLQAGPLWGSCTAADQLKLRTLERRCASIMPSKDCGPLKKPMSSRRPSNVSFQPTLSLVPK